MENRPKGSIRTAKPDPLSPAPTQGPSLRGKAFEKFESLALWLVAPGSLEADASGLLDACNRGSRHFVVNGKSDAWSKTAIAALEIRCDDPQKHERAAPTDRVSRPLSDSSPTAKLAVSSKPLAAALPDHKDSTRRPKSPPPVKKRPLTPFQQTTDTAGEGHGKRHFDVVTVDGVEQSIDPFRRHLYRIDPTS